MGYIVRTKQEHLDGFEPLASSTVDTLEEAKRTTRNLLVGRLWDDRNRDTSSRWVARCWNLPESGGIIGPLANGTIIEVRPTPAAPGGVS